MFRSARWWTDVGHEIKYDWYPDLGREAFAEACELTDVVSHEFRRRRFRAACDPASFGGSNGADQLAAHAARRLNRQSSNRPLHDR